MNSVLASSISPLKNIHCTAHMMSASSTLLQAAQDYLLSKVHKRCFGIKSHHMQPMYKQRGKAITLA